MLYYMLNVELVRVDILFLLLIWRKIFIVMIKYDISYGSSSCRCRSIKLGKLFSVPDLLNMYIYIYFIMQGTGFFSKLFLYLLR